MTEKVTKSSKARKRAVKNEKLTLQQIAKMASDAGMSYGKYVAKHNL